MVVQPPTAPLDPRIPEPRGVHTTRKNPLETVQHPVANPFKYEIVQLYGNSKDTNGPIATRTKNSNSSKLIFPIPVFKFFARTFYRSIKFFYRTVEHMTRAGAPPTTQPSGTSFVTTDPPATMELEPITTPGMIKPPPPIQTSSIISMVSK